ncbi:MAG: retron system putative HNH endonuclease [Thermoanaerobaculia bacterium]
MIWLDRDRRDEGGWPIRPDQAWLDLAAEARRDALREAEAHEARASVYGHGQVRAALEALFHDKCAYCETESSAGFDWNVEHFRPKGQVAERADHPGYYWLAYEWSNLYPSCSHCNQRRKDRPRWGDLRHAGSGGKMDQFPLEDESTRALSPGDDLGTEARLLLDPCTDRPEEHLRYTVDGQVMAVVGSRKGKVSIDVFHLRRSRLRDKRRNKVEAVVELLKLIRKQEGRGNIEAARDLRAFLDTWFLADSCEHAATARAVVRDPALFGL